VDHPQVLCVLLQESLELVLRVVESGRPLVHQLELGDLLIKLLDSDLFSIDRL